MKRSWPFLIALLICGLAVGAAPRSVCRDLQASSEAASSARGHLAALQRRAEELNRELETPAPVAQVPQHPRVPAKAPPRNSNEAGLLVIARDPRLRAWAIQSQVDRMRLAMGAAMDRLHLTDTQRAGLESAARRLSEARFDLLEAAAAQGLHLNDPTVAAEQRQLQDQDLSDEQAALGDAYAGWQQEVHEQSFLNTVRQLMQSTFQTDGAFTPVQADQLARVFANRAGKSAPGVEGPGYDWAGILTDAQGILTPQQMAYFNLAVTSLRSRALMSGYERGRLPLAN